MIPLVEYAQAIDILILRSINGYGRLPWVATASEALSSRWILALVMAIICLQLGRRRFWVGAGTALVLVLADLGTTRVLKPAFERPRPCHVLSELILPDGCGGLWGFPSGHAVLGFVLVGALAPRLRGEGIWLLPLAAMVALSRVVLGVHYPSDVLVGASLGFVLGWMVPACLSRLRLSSTE